MHILVPLNLLEVAFAGVEGFGTMSVRVVTMAAYLCVYTTMIKSSIWPSIHRSQYLEDGVLIAYPAHTSCVHATPGTSAQLPAGVDTTI